MPTKQHRLLLPRSREGVPYHAPVVTIDSPNDGATVVITANVHGDEVTGVTVAHKLIELLPDQILRGKVVIYPTMNPDGLAKMTRKCQGQDLNRLFPGDALGSPADRSARVLWDDINRHHPDLLIDLHADSPISVPYAIVDRAVTLDGEKRSTLEKRTEMLAKATGFTVLREYADKQYANYNLHRSLSGAICNRLHTPSLTIEAGPRLFADETIVGATIQAVMGTLGAIGTTLKRAVTHATKINHDNLRRSPGPKPTKEGILRLTVAPGDHVERGTIVAEILDLNGGTIEVLRSAGDAYVIALPERIWTKAGVAVGTFAVEDN